MEKWLAVLGITQCYTWVGDYIFSRYSYDDMVLFIRSDVVSYSVLHFSLSVWNNLNLAKFFCLTEEALFI